MTYNLSCMNATGGALGCVNTNSGGSFGYSLLFVIAILLFYGFRLYRFTVAFLTASFILAVIAGLLFGLGLLAGWVAVLCVINLVGAIFIKILGEGS